MQPNYAKCDKAAVAAAMADLGVAFSKKDDAKITQMAHGMVSPWSCLGTLHLGVAGAAVSVGRHPPSPGSPA
jgi:hypothetical protein